MDDPAGQGRSQGGEGPGVLERQSQQVWQAHQLKVKADGTPLAVCAAVTAAAGHRPQPLAEPHVTRALVSVAQAMRRRGLSEAAMDEVKREVRVTEYEQPQETVNIALDDVGVKKQKAHHQGEGPGAKAQGAATTAEADPPAPQGKRPSVRNTVAQIAHAGQRFTLTGTSVLQGLIFVLAFLLNNRLITLRLRFFTDGERSLQEAIIDFFVWHPAVSLILDGFHRVKKCKEELSLACRGRHLRNAHLSQLLPLLWFGLVDRAQDYLRTVPDADLKHAQHLTRLIDSLERHRQRIPCHALRRQWGAGQLQGFRPNGFFLQCRENGVIRWRFLLSTGERKYLSPVCAMHHTD